MDPRRDAATTDSLGEAIRAVLPALERFLEFEGPDPARHRSHWRPALDRALPATGIGRDATLAELSELVIANGLRVGHPGFSGWVTTGPSDVAAAADLAQAVAVPQRWWTTAGNFVDDLAMRWLIELLGFPASFVGTFTSGGSTANLVGIGAARQHAGERLGLRPSLDGIEGMVEPRVYASSETHHVVGRALGVLGMGRTQPALASRWTDPARSTSTSSRPPSTRTWPRAGPRLRSWAAPEMSTPAGSIPWPSWPGLPTSAACGCTSTAPTAASGCSMSGFAGLYGDVSAYDSFAIDPHKWLAAPVGTGAAIVRDRGHPRPCLHDRDGRLRSRPRGRQRRCRRPGLALR